MAEITKKHMFGVDGSHFHIHFLVIFSVGRENFLRE